MPHRIDSLPTRRVAVGVFLLSLGLLLYELCLTRVLSTLYYYHTAFLAISVALLGLGAGGLWVHLFPRLFEQRLAKVLAGVALSMTLLPPLFPLLHLNLRELERVFEGPFLRSFGLAVSVCLLPFLGGGASFALIFSRYPRSVARLYAADLLGAAFATLLMIPTMEWLQGPGALLFSGVLVALAAICLIGRRPGAIVTFAVLAGITTLQVTTECFAIQIDLGQKPAPKILYEKWNAFSRVVVLENAGWYRGLALRPGEKAPRQLEALIDINAYAPMVAFDGDLKKVELLRRVVSNAAHHLLPEGRNIAILGPGCGKDILGALHFAPKQVVGIELNPILVNDLVLDRYRDFTGDLYRHERVRILVGDGRATLSRLPESFDLIIANSVATWAAQGTGAMNLTEQTLFTREALSLYADKLTDDGILSISLWDESGHSLPLRLISTWRTATGPRDLAERVAVIVNPWSEVRSFATVLLAKRPFSPSKREALADFAWENGFQLDHSGESSPSDETPYSAYFRDPDLFTKNFAFDIHPSTDDKPFFFYTLNASEAVRFWDKKRRSENAAYASLVLSLMIVTVLVTVGIAAPLWWTRRVRREHQGLLGREVTYFAALGAAFLLVEIAILQRLSLLLGHPTYGLAVGLGGLLAWSGLGSRLADRWVHSRNAGRTLGHVLMALIVVSAATWWLVPETEAIASMGLTGRIVICLLLLAPSGLLMGMPMAAGLALIAQRPTASLPWAFGLNGATGVLASVLAIFLATLFGFTVTFATGLLGYGIAYLSRPRAVLSDDDGVAGAPR